MFGLMPNGELRQANLKMLFQKAKQYESSNFKGLYNFINFIDRLKLSSGDLGSAKLIGENDNVIRIMSIHKSKGLEFPVVFLSSTGKQFNLMDLNDSVLLHQEMGIGVKYIDYDKQIQYDTLSKASLRSKMLIETLSEEMRILYVALTRAKEKLIITGIKNDYQKDFLKMSEQVERYIKKDGKINTILIKKYKKYLDWILLVYEYEKEKNKNCMLLNLYKKKDILNRCKKIQKEKVNVIEELNKKEITKEEFKTLEKILNYTYPNKLATTIPTKTSVTKLKQVEQEKLDIGIEELIGKQRNLEDKIEDVIEFPKPQFLKLEEKNKLTGAQKGTLIHLCMQNLDEKVDYNLIKVKELINSLVEKQIITKIEADNINPFKILEFTKSEIWRELKTAKLIEREKPFYLNIPANTIYNEEIEETILAQGVIDLYYVNKNNELILVDYKTDYIEKNKKYELVNKYKKQLELYQEAIEQSFNKKVSKKYIYSTCLGQAIEIQEN
jgi:ATP-dependent helicase/nuclease subunit A